MKNKELNEYLKYLHEYRSIKEELKPCLPLKGMQECERAYNKINNIAKSYFKNKELKKGSLKFIKEEILYLIELKIRYNYYIE